MRPEGITERRKAKTQAFRLGQPLFIQVPRTIAASVLAGCTLLALAASNLTFPSIAFGPVFLLICAFGAWFVGSRYAVVLLMFIAAIEFLNGHAVFLHDRPIVTGMDLAIRASCALAVVLMLGVAREALEIEWRFARLDPLTGAQNRKAFFEAVSSDADASGIAVLMFADVNGLKRVNDRLGHEAGDEALQDFAARVKKVIRKEDLFARIGGDEFVIFFKVQDRSAAHVVASRLDTALNRGVKQDGTHLTCSLGVLILLAGSKNIDAELQQADRLMYFAKRERIGVMMATSIDGEMQQLMPIAPEVESVRRQAAAFRAIERYSENAGIQSSPDRSAAA